MFCKKGPLVLESKGDPHLQVPLNITRVQNIVSAEVHYQPIPEHRCTYTLIAGVTYTLYD